MIIINFQFLKVIVIIAFLISAQGCSRVEIPNDIEYSYERGPYKYKFTKSENDRISASLSSVDYNWYVMPVSIVPRADIAELKSRICYFQVSGNKLIGSINGKMNVHCEIPDDLVMILSRHSYMEGTAPNRQFKFYEVYNWPLDPGLD